LAYTIPWVLSFYTNLESRDLLAIYAIIVFDAICIFFLAVLRYYEKQLSVKGRKNENLRNLRYIWITSAIIFPILTVVLYKENILVLVVIMLAFFGMIWLTTSAINPIFYSLNSDLEKK